MIAKVASHAAAASESFAALRAKNIWRGSLPSSSGESKRDWERKKEKEKERERERERCRQGKSPPVQPQQPTMIMTGWLIPLSNASEMRQSQPEMHHTKRMRCLRPSAIAARSNRPMEAVEGLVAHPCLTHSLLLLLAPMCINVQTGSQTNLRQKVEGKLGEGGVAVRREVREVGGQVPEGAEGVKEEEEEELVGQAN